jgi:hypothetical protein
MYYFIERAIAIVKPKQPFLQWIINTFPESVQISLDTMRLDCNTYLIDPIGELEDGINFIDEKFAEIFSMELASWTDDETLWPDDIDLKMFWDWFDVEVHSTIIDLSSHEDNEAKNTIH